VIAEAFADDGVQPRLRDLHGLPRTVTPSVAWELPIQLTGFGDLGLR
jgi:hypothetical protein